MEENSNINIERLISKITFEFFFFISAHTAASNLHFLEPLYNHIITGKSQKDILITRLWSASLELKPYHAISIEFFGGHTRVQIVFFGLYYL